MTIQKGHIIISDSSLFVPRKYMCKGKIITFANPVVQLICLYLGPKNIYLKNRKYNEIMVSVSGVLLNHANNG